MTQTQAPALEVDRDFVVETLTGLVDVPSPTGSEEACARFMAERCDELGMQTRLQRFAPGRANAVCTLPGSGGGKDLLLTGHLDTSYRGTEPELTAPGFKPKALLDGEHVIGLGVANMKCGIAAAIGAAHALTRAGVATRGDLILAGVAGEIEMSPVDEFQGQEYEGYGTGTRYLVAKGVTADAAIVGEATGFRVSLGHVGSIWLKVTVHGDLMHTALSVRDDVVHAVYEAQEVIAALRRWIPEYQRRTEFMGVKCGVTVAAVRAGNPWRAARTPQTCVLYLDVRYPPGLRAVEVKREVAEVLAEVTEQRPELRVDLESYVVAAPALLAEEEEIVVATRAAAGAVIGGEIATTFRGPMDDSTHLIDAGIPTINFGVPGPDVSPAQRMQGERVRIDDVVRLARVYATLAASFCNRGPE